jgi:hypothetical protein
MGLVEAFSCSLCGAHDGQELPDDKVKCAYCGTVFRRTHEHVVIGRGANVVFGPNANVRIRGGMRIESGANVSVLGKLEVLELGDESKFKPR